MSIVSHQTEAADHLVDDVLPPVPYCQMVLSFPLLLPFPFPFPFPLPLRYWMQSNRKLFAKVWVCHDGCRGTTLYLLNTNNRGAAVLRVPDGVT